MEGPSQFENPALAVCRFGDGLQPLNEFKSKGSTFEGVVWGSCFWYPDKRRAPLLGD